MEKEKKNKRLDQLREDDDDKLEDLDQQIYVEGEEEQLNEQQKQMMKAKLEAEQRTQQLIDMVKLILRSLAEHFQDAWNIFDCLIIGLSLASAINWIRIIYMHSLVFTNTFDIAAMDSSLFGDYIKKLINQDGSIRPSLDLVQAS